MVKFPHLDFNLNVHLGYLCLCHLWHTRQCLFIFMLCIMDLYVHVLYLEQESLAEIAIEKQPRLSV